MISPSVKRLLLIFLFLSILRPDNISASEAESKSFITIVNPVRVAPYTPNSSESIEAQYAEIKNKNLPATWLLSFDVINNKGALDAIEKFDNKQELGILMEVSSASAKAANVIYNQTDSWHRSNSIFLTGYTQGDRIKLIDKVFEDFREEFGYYPVSVGAWWIDSFSLEYMSKKYKVVANLNVSDQMGTDGYTLWGAYWSSPYYPSKINAAIPAQNNKDKLNVVTLRWASRDPLNGYKSPDGRESTRFSTQDYFTIGLGHDYFENLLRLYTSREFGQITIGLEGDFPPEVYSGNFSTQLSIAEKLAYEGIAEFSTMKSFASMYMSKYKSLSPGFLIESSDILGGSERIYWFQNPRYRIGIIYDFKNNRTQIIDLRSYYQDFSEPFYQSPSSQYELFSIAPSIIDSGIKPDLRITLDTGSLIGSDERSITFEKGKIVFEDKRIKFLGINFKPDRRITDSGLVRIEKDSIYPSQKYIYSSDGLEFSEIKPKIPFALKSRVPQILIYISVAFFVLALITLLIVLKKRNRKYANLFFFGLVIGCLLYVGFKTSDHLYVSQSEIDALLVLKNLDDGKVLLYDKDCLRCSFSSKNKPAAMEGRKDYVKKLSKKDTVYSLDFVLAKNPDQAKAIINKIGAKYIYLAKYEAYIEALSFNPLDVGLKRVYENANAAIYEVN